MIYTKFHRRVQLRAVTPHPPQRRQRSLEGRRMGQAAGSITRLIPEVLRRDPLAVEQLWERYVARIEGVARPLVAALPPGAGDEQDVAQSAFHAFCLAAANGQAPRLTDRNELWRLLSTIARHKAVDRVRRELRDCRGGGAQPSPQGLSHAPSGDPTPS
ncbi:MAG TPA: ECF-type sigma factor, partial [Lacipirellulaceae bacterium]|nr:ECF-type sigma factor [Lacipirellulaceae bacterium]